MHEIGDGDFVVLNWLGFLRNFPMGIFLGFCFGIIVFWLFGADLSADMTRYGTYVLTALASLLASATAFATAMWNTEHQRLARLRSARALLPYSLAQLNVAIENGITNSKVYYWDHWETERPDYLAEISISEEVFQNMKECIEHSDGLAARWLTVAISRYQVCHSRLRSRPRDFSEVQSETMESDSYATYIAEQFADWILLKQIVGVLFDFSRGAEVLPTQIEANTYTLPLGDEATGISELTLEKIAERISGNRLTLTALEK